MRIVAIKEDSAGNDRVGNMWKETKIFDEDDTLKDVMLWVGSTSKNVTVTVAQNDAEEFEEKRKANFQF